ncbi:2-dehydro-3-deoxygalactonokinase [Pistricoccus aurantiacus]|uniref:2-dehydro-3-deoxygalactonokinase n=1 Tax=Pistricoccus aurantiacus TaxID=1883414 RepID=UPI003629636A
MIAWIAVDWGSSNLRTWALDADDNVIAQAGSPRGMLGLAPDEFEGTLLELIDEWLPESVEAPLPALICGMAGARQGWVEAAYLPLDEGPGDALARLGSRLTSATTQDSRLQVQIVPGLCQHPGPSGHDAFDVMRGEETQLAGLIAKRPGFSGAVCQPGTHSKWARLGNGRIASFDTFMSGELYKLLRYDSVLKHSLRGDDLSDEAQRAAFLAAIDTALAAPERLSAELFGIRARDLLDTQLTQDETRGAWLGARLSGLVLGLELAGATASLPTDSQIVLIGADALCQRYRIALEHLGFTVGLEANEEMILTGLGHIRHAAATS